MPSNQDVQISDLNLQRPHMLYSHLWSGFCSLINWIRSVIDLNHIWILGFRNKSCLIRGHEISLKNSVCKLSMICARVSSLCSAQLLSPRANSKEVKNVSMRTGHQCFRKGKLGVSVSKTPSDYMVLDQLDLITLSKCSTSTNCARFSDMISCDGPNMRPSCSEISNAHLQSSLFPLLLFLVFFDWDMSHDSWCIHFCK